MSRSSTLILIGVLIALVSFLGIPRTVINLFLPIFGLIVIAIGFLIRTDAVKRSRQDMAPAISQTSDVISPIA